MVRDRAIWLNISKFAKFIGYLSYISVNTEIEFQINICSFGRVRTINVLKNYCYTKLMYGER